MFTRSGQLEEEIRLRLEQNRSGNMTTLKGVVPESCGDKPAEQADLFGEVNLTPCEGCRTGNIRAHNGTYCLIRDWHAKPLKAGAGPGRKMRFVDLMKQGRDV